MLFKPSNLNSNLALTLGYLNPALNNSALVGQVQWNTDFGPTGVVHAVSLTEFGQFHRLRLISPKVFICPK